MSHNATYKLTNEESEMVERYNYIFQSTQALVSILAREFRIHSKSNCKIHAARLLR